MTTWQAEGAAATAFDVMDYASTQCSALWMDCSKEPVFQDLCSADSQMLPAVLVRVESGAVHVLLKWSWQGAWRISGTTGDRAG